MACYEEGFSDKLQIINILIKKNKKKILAPQLSARTAELEIQLLKTYSVRDSMYCQLLWLH